MLELKESIKSNGLIEPITLYQGEILDGRNRYTACLLLGIKPVFEEYKGNDPLQFVLSKNINRRHLSESQRAAIAAQIASLPQGRQTKNDKPADLPVYVPTQAEAATVLNVSERLVRDAKKIKNESPDNFQKIVEGKKTVTRTIKEIKGNKKTIKEKESNNNEQNDNKDNDYESYSCNFEQNDNEPCDFGRDDDNDECTGNIVKDIENHIKKLKQRIETIVESLNEQLTFLWMASEQHHLKKEYTDYCESLCYEIFGTSPSKGKK
jgi:hypothetical protein